MKQIKILADSTCDLSKELIDAYSIGICPLIVNLDKESHLDCVDIFPDDLYAWVDKTGKLPTTSAPSPDAIESILKQYAAENDLIVFPIGGKISSTFQTFTVLAQSIPEARITVIDSANLSAGIGLQILNAAELIRQGKDYDTVVRECRQTVAKVRAGFIVDSVQYLYKGGRCSAMAALAASALHIHPTLAVVDGEITVDKKIRGDMLSATRKYAQGLEEQMLQARDDVAFITHAGARDDVIEVIRQYVEGLHYFKKVYVTRAGCVISSHCGPGTLGVLFIAK